MGNKTKRSAILGQTSTLSSTVVEVDAIDYRESTEPDKSRATYSIPSLYLYQYIFDTFPAIHHFKLRDARGNASNCSVQ